MAANWNSALARPGQERVLPTVRFVRPRLWWATSKALTSWVGAKGVLKPGIVLEGTVTNVAQFGAFVDLGVHQDGLVHVSQLADRFVEDAHSVVKTGDVVKVRILEVDLARKRIALSMKSGAPAGRAGEAGEGGNHYRAAGRDERARGPRTDAAATAPASAMAAAFPRLKR